MKMINLNSAIEVSEEIRSFVAARAGRLSKALFSVPVYLVSPGLMDRLYPPSRRRFLNPRCVEEMLGSFEREEPVFDELEDLPRRLERRLEMIERCRGEAVSGFAATGVYFSSVPDEVVAAVEEASGKEILRGRSIFICPERVEDLASKVTEDLFGERWRFRRKEKIFRLAFAKVHLHELAHAYMDGGRRGDTWWERLIEESLANALAYVALRREMRDFEKAAFERLVAEQPLEYRGWRDFVPEEEAFFFPAWRPLPWAPVVWRLATCWRRRVPPEGPFLPWFGDPFLFMPRPLRRHLARLLWHELPHPWDEIWRFALEHPSEVFVGEFWPLLAMRLLKSLV